MASGAAWTVSIAERESAPASAPAPESMSNCSCAGRALSLNCCSSVEIDERSSVGAKDIFDGTFLVFIFLAFWLMVFLLCIVRTFGICRRRRGGPPDTEAASSSSPRHDDDGAFPAILHVDIGKQLAFPDSLSTQHDRIAAAIVASHSNRGTPAPPSPAAPMLPLPPTDLPTPRASTESPAAAPRPSTEHAHSLRPAAGAAGVLKAARARRLSFCVCGRADAVDGGEVDEEPFEASPWTVEAEIVRARQRFERLTDAALPAVVVQPDAALCLCALDRLSSAGDVAEAGEEGRGEGGVGEPGGGESESGPACGATRDSTGQAASADAAGASAGDDVTLSVWALRQEHSAAPQAVETHPERGGSMHAGGRDRANEGPAEAAEAAEEGPAEGHEAVAGTDTCYCFRIDLEPQDFEHTRH